jgi:Sortase domain
MTQGTGTTSRWRSRRSVLGAAIAVVLVAVGVVLLVVGLGDQKSAPQPSAAAAGSVTAAPGTTAGPPASPPTSAKTPTTAPTGKTTAKPAGPLKPTSSCCVVPTDPFVKGPVLPKSAPVSVSIPSIGVTSDLLKLGKDAKGGIEVPPVDEPTSHAGWYTNSPTPGELGPSVLLGHVDSHKYGPGVFFKLGALRPGQTIDVTRADHTVAVFKIDGVVSYSKTKFPTKAVYGNIDHAGLRLITCGGTFNPSAGHYENNIVAYASLVSSHPAG